MLDILERFRGDLTLVDRKAILALIYTAVGLSSIYYLKDQQAAGTFFDAAGLEYLGGLLARPVHDNLIPLGYWVLIVTIFYFVVPVLCIKFLFRESVADYGLNFRIERGFWKLFGLCTAIMLPLVYWMSTTAGFAAKYPFFQVYDGGPYVGTAFLKWELIYFVQFFGLEFFFRGFLVHSLKPAVGIYSIFAMTVPYCMIHFGKPPAETFAAIFAGIFLGWLSYRNGNIWMGLLLHCTVALSMDVLALYNKGLLV